MLGYFTGYGSISGDFTIHEYGEEQCSRGYAFGPYVRSAYFLHYICSGKGVFESRGKRYELSAGQMFLICPGDLTYYKADDNDPWFYRWISFDGGYSQLLLRSAGLDAENPIFNDNNFKAGNALSRIVSEGRMSFCRLMSLFWAFADAISVQDGKTHSGGKKNYAALAKAYMHSHYMEDISVSEIAAVLGVDRSYLSRLFKEAEGVSPQEYLIAYRLRLAKSFLRETDFSIGNIARLVGYSAQIDFSKIFKSREGVSPRTWREKS